MSSIWGSPAVFRHLVKGAIIRTTARNQRRWAQVHDVRFLATTQESRSVLEKYREKLDKKAREEGLPDIEALKKAYSDKIEAVRKRADAQDPLVAAGVERPSSTTSTTIQKPVEQAAKAATKEKKESGTGIKPLSSILDVEKVRSLPERELTAIWRLRHANNPQSLCAVVPSSTYKHISAAAHAFPQFVLPVPHPEQGAELHFLQWTFDPPSKTSTVLFTQLAEYKNRGEFAQPHTTVTHYLDLAEGNKDEGMVLMQGLVMENRGFSVENAQWLVMCLQRFYGGWDGIGGQQGRERAEERRRLLEWFSRGDERFSVEKLMEEAERMG
ncbi:ATP11 protein-domain-containing protein [Rhypophila decipiens]|uniref:ATP11 protein-domain-containing protein n=1 Tax=Rhypophila decipiens TaxID=261697 RepID=A0AAN7BC07_9PEZI|nr:ATP11 protein-domain-containing protein [Rhypophila decipiens]